MPEILRRRSGARVAWVGARIPAETLDLIERLADEQGISRPDWLRLAIGDRLEHDLGDACPDDPDGLHDVGCGCDDGDDT